MQAYCRDVMLVPNPRGREGFAKRLLQVRSLASIRSFERFGAHSRSFSTALTGSCARSASMWSTSSSRILATTTCARLPPARGCQPWSSTSRPIAYHLARQFARVGGKLGRRLYAGANWRKLRREELGTYGGADGVYVCSRADEQRLLNEAPGVRTAVVPNAADVEYFQPRPADPPPDGQTVVYFGLLSTVPNIDAVVHFVQEIWPRIAKARPDARFKIIGGRPPPSLQALAGPRVELTGFVPDLRPHLGAAAVVVVPLRLGGGTRLKIVEAMAMGKAIVSTTLGAEGIDAIPGRDILLEDQPAAFAGCCASPVGRARFGGAHRSVSKAAGGGSV